MGGAWRSCHEVGIGVRTVFVEDALTRTFGICLGTSVAHDYDYS